MSTRIRDVTEVQGYEHPLVLFFKAGVQKDSSLGAVPEAALRTKSKDYYNIGIVGINGYSIVFFEENP